ncbi:hypothetical protein [Aureliella helgolandensis]|uniref:Uncharacterized protein n=1 Tax=Aureliella helgolandensis TaxID=2527968 RepID=A0A518G4W3_9BACT|nr:hypothetical protein [Aureliella helgolandensis]QDV23590.1 hypothetical protein Q31a_18920 [Aureliella helgolandensis]
MVICIIAALLVVIGFGIGACVWQQDTFNKLARCRNAHSDAIASHFDERQKLEREIKELTKTLGTRSEEVMQLRRRIAKAETDNAALREEVLSQTNSIEEQKKIANAYWLEMSSKARQLEDQKKFLGELSTKFGTIAEKL